MPDLDDEDRKNELVRLARNICRASMRCRIIGPTSLALDLTSSRSTQVMHFELQRFIAAKVMQPQNVMLGQLSKLTDDDIDYVAKCLPVVSVQLWNAVEDILR